MRRSGWIFLLLCALFLGACGHRRSSDVRIIKHDYRWVCPFDGSFRSDGIVVYLPFGSSLRSPALVFHRGRGFNYDDYNDVLSSIASRGVVCASVSDSVSFYAPKDALAANPYYDATDAFKGMESASYALVEARNQLFQLNQDSTGPMFQTIDERSTYFGGHSRGGGAVEYCQGRGVPAKGFLYYMAFDVFGAVPASTPNLPPTQSLVFSATLDGDLGYAGPAGIVNHMTGSTRLVTILGGIHNFMGDFNTPNAPALITRDQEQQIVVDETAEFIR